jgi:hypothetical protein
LIGCGAGPRWPYRARTCEVARVNSMAARSTSSEPAYCGSTRYPARVHCWYPSRTGREFPTRGLTGRGRGSLGFSVHTGGGARPWTPGSVGELRVLALRTELPDAVRVLDCFHVVRLGFACVDEVRRRAQQESLHRRGHRDDPLYRIRRVVRRRADRLSPHARRRLEVGLALGDPTARSPSPGGSPRTYAPSTSATRSTPPAAISTGSSPA